MIKVDPFSPEGVYDTLLELRLQDWAHEQDPGVKTYHTYLSHYVIIDNICTGKSWLKALQISEEFNMFIYQTFFFNLIMILGN